MEGRYIIDNRQLDTTTYIISRSMSGVAVRIVYNTYLCAMLCSVNSRHYVVEIERRTETRRGSGLGRGLTTYIDETTSIMYDVIIIIDYVHPARLLCLTSLIQKET